MNSFLNLFQFLMEDLKSTEYVLVIYFIQTSIQSTNQDCWDCFCGLEIEELADHGITMPPNMQGLTDDQIVELKLVDDWAEKCEPSGGHVFNKDDIGRRNGRGYRLLC